MHEIRTIIIIIFFKYYYYFFYFTNEYNFRTPLSPRLLVVDTGSDLALAAMVYYNKSQDVKRAGFPFNFMFLNMTSPLNGNRIREAIENWIAAGPVSNSRNWAVSLKSSFCDRLESVKLSSLVHC